MTRPLQKRRWVGLLRWMARGVGQPGRGWPVCLASLVAFIVALPLPVGPRAEFVGAIPATGSASLSVGFTFSQRQAEYLDLPFCQTFQAALSLSPQVIRLGAYWDEIEPRRGHYDFSTMDWMLDDATARGLQVILTVGMKAPRWPEYYLPSWLQRRVRAQEKQISDDQTLRAHTLRFMEQVVRRYADRETIAFWQIENEPLDPSGPHDWQIGPDFLREEVTLVRRLDRHRRPIIVSMFVGTDPFTFLPPRRKELQDRAQTILEMADVLGLDVYPSRGLRIGGHDLYFDWSPWPWEQLVIDLQQRARQAGKEAWIMEAQAEPWEPARVVHTDPQPSRSARSSTALQIFERLRTAGFRTILFWGVEHWYLRRHRHQDMSWWDELSKVFLGTAERAAGTEVAQEMARSASTQASASRQGDWLASGAAGWLGLSVRQRSQYRAGDCAERFAPQQRILLGNLPGEIPNWWRAGQDIRRSG